MPTLSELGEISKAGEKRRKSPKGYRASRLKGINPRSETYVRENSNIRRLGGPLLGSAVGTVAGGVGGAALRLGPKGTQIASGLGGVVGTNAGMRRNIKSGDTVSYNRNTGAKAKTKVAIPYVGTYNAY